MADVLTAYRSSVSSVTGYTSFYLLCGRRNRMPMIKLLKVRQTNYFGNRLDDLANDFKLAREQTTYSRRHNRERLQRRVNVKGIQVGDTAVVKAGERLTFTRRWDTQYDVYRVRGGMLWIKHQTTGDTRIVHRERCRLVHPNISWDEVRPRPHRKQIRSRPSGTFDVICTRSSQPAGRGDGRRPSSAGSDSR